MHSILHAENLKKKILKTHFFALISLSARWQCWPGLKEIENGTTKKLLEISTTDEHVCGKNQKIQAALV